MREKDLSGGIKNLPTKVKDACEKFISPILSKYNSNENHYFLKLSLLTDVNFVNAEKNNLLESYKKSLVNTFYGYNLLGKHQESPLGTWFKDVFGFNPGGAN